MAVGGYGRRELSLQSDIDVLLLHAGRDDIGELADRLWYPIWDARMKLGHAVRTAKEALALAADDLDTATGLLRPATWPATARSPTSWPQGRAASGASGAKRWLAAMAARVRERHSRAGEVAFLLEPDLKEGRGGLRDVHALRWAQAARSILWDADHASLDEAYDTLLAARVELHRRTGRPGDRLLLQEQDGVADALGYPDADVLMRDGGATAARTIAWTSDDAWARIESSLAGPLAPRPAERATWAAACVLRDGEVHHRRRRRRRPPTPPWRCGPRRSPPATAPSSTGARWPAWPPRPRSRRARGPTPPAPRSSTCCPPGRRPSCCWRRSTSRACGSATSPSGRAVRSKPQRNAYHRFTVDRHLWEAAVAAGALAGRVAPARPAGAGRRCSTTSARATPGDHTDNGVALLAEIGPRHGPRRPRHRACSSRCAATTCCWPTWPPGATSTTRPPSTVVAAALGSREVLELLAALTEADSLATGPAAWSDWKAGLVRALVTRVDHVLGGGEALEVADEFPTAEQRALLAAGEQTVRADGDTLTVVTPDRPGLFSRVAGVLSLHGLGVLDAAAATERRAGPSRCSGSSRASGPPSRGTKVVADLDLALAGRLAIRARLADRVRTYGARRGAAAADERRARGALRPGRVGRRHRRRGARHRRRWACSTASPARWPTSTSTSWAPRCRRSAPRWSTRSSCARPTGPRSPTRRCWPRPSAPCSTPWTPA